MEKLLQNIDTEGGAPVGYCLRILLTVDHREDLNSVDFFHRLLVCPAENTERLRNSHAIRPPSGAGAKISPGY